ncbi:WecB/TagA/CpsF family glycosyltransferase [Segatella bryantii]|uniref:WecB/TagA/CpsF family glycosyltransferase n=1 Tax=Segatella bryantii TaxID=77095 RepID=UPI00241F6BB1|nr:WecB/TagA/CpsF family glycosyltransferase [Segatella bryantii]
MDTIRILNINICNISLGQFLNQLHEGVVFTPNVDHLCKLQQDREFYDAYQKANWIICDSRVLQILSFFLPKTIKETIPGSSFFEAFYHYHKDNINSKIFILGGKKGIADKARVNINRKIEREIVVGAYSPSFHIDDGEIMDIVDIINESGATVVLTGLGAPKQEKFIIKAKKLLPNVKIWLALGATVDFEAGTMKRTPQIWRHYGLEWLYRTIQEPKRLIPRYAKDFKIFYYLIKQLLGLYRNPFKE